MGETLAGKAKIGDTIMSTATARLSFTEQMLHPSSTAEWNDPIVANMVWGVIVSNLPQEDVAKCEEMLLTGTTPEEIVSLGKMTSFMNQALVGALDWRQQQLMGGVSG